MGKQSARLYYQGKDHKDIHFKGRLHDKMYVGSNLVWEKLYPDSYFIDTRTSAQEQPSGLYKYKYITVILSKDGVEERVQSIESAIPNSVDYRVCFLIGQNISHRQNKKYVFGGIIRTENKTRCFCTHDFRKLKILISHYETSNTYVPMCGIGEKGFYFGGNVIWNINDDLTITEVKCDEVPQIEYYGFPCGDRDYICLGNYAYLFRSDYEGSEDRNSLEAFSEFYVIDENGHGELHRKEYKIPYRSRDPIQSEEATQYYIDTLFSDTHYGSSSLLIKDSIYKIAVNEQVQFGSGALTRDINALLKRNLSTWETEEISFYDSTKYDLSEVHIVYASVNHAVFLSFIHERNNYNTQKSIFIKLNSENIFYKEINDFSINVYKENRKISIKSIWYANTTIKKDEIILRNLVIDYYLSATMSNGIYIPDAVNGISVKFSYGYQGSWYISGYMYIDNQDFTESENNYIYILEEYENGELVFSR